MATKICTNGGGCITCTGTVGEHKAGLEREEKAGHKYYCCNTPSHGKIACVRIDQVTTITSVREDDDHDDDRRPIFGNPEVVIFTGGQMALPRSRTPHPEAEPVTPPGDVGDD